MYKTLFLILIVVLFVASCGKIGSIIYKTDIEKVIYSHYKVTEEAYVLKPIYSNPKYEWPVPMIDSKEDFEITVIKVVKNEHGNYKRMAFVKINNIINNMSWIKKLSQQKNGKWEVDLGQRIEDTEAEIAKASRLGRI
ncbi:MAG: hypothetical protein AB7D06_01255 [Pedobacter sp.]